MADLATVEELALVLGLSESDTESAEDLLTLLLDGAEALFEAECGRTEIPFQDAKTGRIEVHDGVRSRKLWLDYPIGDVTAVVVGRDVSDPDVTLDPDDAADMQWKAGSRRIMRTDGGSWWSGDPSFVKVTYTTEADLPEDAKAAVLRLCSQLYGTLERDRGGVASEQLDNYTVSFTNMSTFSEAARKDPAWAIAVENHRRHVAF